MTVGQVSPGDGGCGASPSVAGGGVPNETTLSLLIEGEQKLLAAFDARQANADAKLTATVTGALALPAATLALAGSLKFDTTVLKWGYGVLVGLVIVLAGFRMWGGWLVKEDPKHIPEGHKPKRRISTESARAAAARDDWWDFDAGTDPIEVQCKALDLWRSRAYHSRHIAQINERIALLGGVLFLLALGSILVLVAVTT